MKTRLAVCPISTARKMLDRTLVLLRYLLLDLLALAFGRFCGGRRVTPSDLRNRTATRGSRFSSGRHLIGTARLSSPRKITLVICTRWCPTKRARRQQGTLLKRDVTSPAASEPASQPVLVFLVLLSNCSPVLSWMVAGGPEFRKLLLRTSSFVRT